MSTPSETMRTATSHGRRRGELGDPGRRARVVGGDERAPSCRSGAESAAILVHAPGRSRSRARRRPAARGAPRSASRAPSEHGRQPLPLERERGAEPLPGARAESRSSNVAEWIEPSDADHSICPFVRREVDRPDDAAVARRRRSCTRSQDGLLAAVGTNGIARVSERNGVPESASRAGPRPPRTPACIAAPQARSSARGGTRRARRRRPRTAARATLALSRPAGTQCESADQ